MTIVTTTTTATTRQSDSSAKRIIRLAAVLVIAALLCIIAIVIIRTVAFTTKEANDICSIATNENDDAIYIRSSPAPSSHHRAIIGSAEIFDRLQQALRFRTVTRAPRDYSRDETLRFIEFLRTNFTRIHTSPFVTLEIVNELSLLYTVTGRDRTLKPYLLLAHLDVVPAQSDRWSVPPFDGTIKNGYVYGRGSLDLKSVVIGIMEALDALLADPRVTIERTFYIAIGHDEEGRGLHGAARIAQTLRERLFTAAAAEPPQSDRIRSISNRFIEFILDEGPYIFRDTIPGLRARDVAMIGVAEKGLANVRLAVQGAVGHSSIAPRETAIVRLARAVSRLHSAAHPNRFGAGPERDMIEALAPYAKWPYRMMYANLWLFAPLVARLLEADPLMNAFVRTTTAVTIFHAGIKDNVLPGYAEATVNHRIYPLDTVRDVIEHDRRLVDDFGVDVSVLGVAIEPHPISPYGSRSFGYETIRRSIGQVFPRIAIIPGIMYAATDSRWYLNFTTNIYRFSPGFLTRRDLSIVHGHDERISQRNYVQLINFYHHVMLNANRARLPDSFPIRDEF